MSSTGSGGMRIVGSGSSVVVLHTSTGGDSGGGALINSPATVTNVIIDGSTTVCTAVTDSSNLIDCYEPVGTMTPGT